MQGHVEPDARMMNSAPAAVTWRPIRHEGEPTYRLHVLQINSVEKEEPDRARTSHSWVFFSLSFLGFNEGLTCCCSPQRSLLLPGVGLLVLLPGPGATHTLSSASTRGGGGCGGEQPRRAYSCCCCPSPHFHNHLELNSAASLEPLEFSLVGSGTQTVILQKTV